MKESVVCLGNISPLLPQPDTNNKKYNYVAAETLFSSKCNEMQRQFYLCFYIILSTPPLIQNAWIETASTDTQHSGQAKK